VLFVSFVVNSPGHFSPCEQWAKQIRSTLDELADRTHIEDWQRVQIIRAIQILFQDSVRTDWADDHDWDYAIAATRGLPESHPNRPVARGGTTSRAFSPSSSCILPDEIFRGRSAA